MTTLGFGAHVPWGQVETYLDMVLTHDLAPEIAIKGPELDGLDHVFVAQIASVLDDSGIRPRIHAPFFDLNPGALDPLIREVTLRRLSQTLDFAQQLNADLMVIHPGVDKWRYPRLDQTWMENACQFFPTLIARAAQSDCRLAIENIYEEAPDTLVQLVNRLDSPWFGHCFDAGHWHLFGRRLMEDWLKSISEKLFHLHLHDNHGRADEHLPVGEGTIEFAPLQQHLASMVRPPSITLEAHSPDHLIRSLRQAKALFG